MQIGRVPSLLHSIADARSWLVERLPMTRSPVGYDFFMRVADTFTAGTPLTLPSLLDGVDYPEALALKQLGKMKLAKLLIEHRDGSADGVRRFLATEQLVQLLITFSRKFDSVFVLRQRLRDQQLIAALGEPAMADFAESLYDQFYDLGWLYLHNFGSACFLMASLVHGVALRRGRQARIASCYLEVRRGDATFLLGAQGYAKPGQVDGHAVCVIDESAVFDFGVGNMRKFYRRDAPWALAFEYRPQAPRMGGIGLPSGETMVWKDDWQAPGSAAELARYAPHLDDLLQQYEVAFG